MIDWKKHRGKLLLWRQSHLNQRIFLLFLSFVIGILSGLAAVLLKNIVHYTHVLLTQGFDVSYGNPMYLAYPVIGIGLTVLFVKYIVKDDISHGISRILYAISKRSSIIRRHNNYSSLISSTLTIGFGGSVGLEAPIVLTGSAIGSTLGRFFHLNYKSITLLVGCGAAGAIAGIFKAPIASVVFALEVLLIDLTMVSVVPLLISAVTAAIMAYFLMGDGVIFAFELNEPFLMNTLPYYLGLGIVCGLISLYFTRGVMFVEGRFKKIKSTMVRLIIGGFVLSLLIFLFPPLYGEGYETLRAALHGNSADLVKNSFFYQAGDNMLLFFGYLLLILIFKVVATAVTTASGGVGGIFAPTLFMGGITGFLFSRLMNLTDWAHLPVSHFALVGMGGLMAGVMHAPLTGIFLIAEITGGYALFIPLMVTATVSYLTIMYFEPHSIYHKRLAQRGELITHDKDKAALSALNVMTLLENEFLRVHPNETLGEVVQVVARSNRNIFPVVDDENTLLGIIIMENLRNVMFNTSMYDNTYARDLMYMPDYLINPDDSMEEVARKIQESGKFNLPVVKNGKYLGFISRARVFMTYREKLRDFTLV